MEKVNVLNIKFDNITLEQAIKFATTRISKKQKTMVVTPNAEIAYMCKYDDELLKKINRADLILPDGIGIIHAGRILGTPLKQKVAGIEFAEGLVKEMSKTGKSLYILGGRPGVAKTACDNLCKKYNGLMIAGFQDGYFKDADNVIEKINKSQADVLFVCLGAPKQEIFMNEHFEKFDVSIMCGVGGSADVFAGEAKRAPTIFVKLGLEWFYRLLKEPYRIGRMMKLPLFLLLVIKEKIRGK